MSFSFDTIPDFDAYIAQEIRGYDLLNAIILRLADSIIEPDSTVYDIGCSTGRLLNALAERLANTSPPKPSVTFVGFEPSPNFARVAVPATENVRFRTEFVTPQTSYPDASLVLALFTIHFLPVRDRLPILRRIFLDLGPNGALILAEKVVASDATIESLLTECHVDFKRDTSTPEEILDKQKRLRTILRPLSLAANLRMLTSAGFDRLETFWRINNFVAVIALKTQDGTPYATQ